jgi:prepilin-type N-terminal cleavage/methylation domain-containing protein
MGSRTAAGFSLIEILVVVALFSVLAATSAPAIQAGMQRYAVVSASQEVASTIRAARFQAVGSNRILRVRFNCPSPGKFRVVEYLAAATDAAADRCALSAYPFPPGDTDPATLPNLDGAVQVLPSGMTFGAASDLQIATDGRVTPLAGCPSCAAVPGASPATIVVTNGNTDDDRTLTVSRSGRLQLP